MRAKRVIKVAVCVLNNWALDFEGNQGRILKTCEDAFIQGAAIRLGPELEIPSYGCEDHFKEPGTLIHSWRVLHAIVEKSKALPNLLIITGMPVRHNAALYNCMVSVANGRVLFIYPKQVLCNDDVYRESRWFDAWRRRNEVIDYELPRDIGFEQETTKFGSGYIESTDHVKIGFEMCEEMWAPISPSCELALQGVDIFCNSSASYHELGKSLRRINQRVLSTTSKLGGVYLYANHRGCDGTRVYYDGMSSIAQNDSLYAQIDQFGIEDTATVSAVLDLESSSIHRERVSSFGQQSTESPPIPSVKFNAELLSNLLVEKMTEPITWHQMSEVEELTQGPPAFLWHYLRRSRASGYFLPLSGGQDSSSVALMIRLMCEKVCEAIKANPDSDDSAYYLQGEKVGTDPAELCHRIFFTCYMGSENSSRVTREAAAGLAQDIHANHSSITIDEMVNAATNIFEHSFGFKPSYSSNDQRESMALQNIQARSRMLLSYLYAQAALIPQGRPGFLLVLGSANVDESLVGYLTKYDCSSADINPIGSISKRHLREFLRYIGANYAFPHMKEVIAAVPTAELLPLVEGEVAQTDEEDIGLTYDELSEMGKLRRPGSCDPYSMFVELAGKWHPRNTYDEIAEKVERFFNRYASNRHKSTVSTPAYHATSYSNDDHRNDHRPFLYPEFRHQFQAIRKAVDLLKREKQ